MTWMDPCLLQLSSGSIIACCYAPFWEALRHLRKPIMGMYLRAAGSSPTPKKIHLAV